MPRASLRSVLLGREDKNRMPLATAFGARPAHVVFLRAVGTSETYDCLAQHCQQPADDLGTRGRFSRDCFRTPMDRLKLRTPPERTFHLHFAPPSHSTTPCPYRTQAPLGRVCGNISNWSLSAIGGSSRNIST